MNKEVFYKELSSMAKKIEFNIKENELDKFYNYMNLLLEWNEKINLTAIIDPKEIILKHFIDSLTIEKYINRSTKIIDVGTGAGFPGVPLNIVRDDIEITLLDSLNKRINFLNDIIEKLNLTNIEAIHGRVEEVAKNKKYREQYDVATSRAVAPLNVLLEYLLPLIKINGICICMKGSNKEEIEMAKNALNILGGKIEKIDEITLPDSEIKRTIIIVRKVTKTPEKYPRKAGTPSKEPL